MSRQRLMPSAPIEVRAGVATDAGRKREHNEDSYFAKAPVFVVADGMGGYAAGEVASAAVAAEFGLLTGRPSVYASDVRSAFGRAVAAVHSLPAGGGAGAGTTLTGVVVSDSGGVGYWLCFNIGDSRTYRMRGGQLEQISVDHSVVQELVEAGSLTRTQASIDSRRNQVTKAIGAGGDGELDFWFLPAEPGDRMLLCSDGLTGELDDGRIAAILRETTDPQAAAERLVAAAVDAGGRDNVTVVVVDAFAVVEAFADGDADTVPRASRAGGRR